MGGVGVTRGDTTTSQTRGTREAQLEAGVAARGGFAGGIGGVRVTKVDVTTSQMRGMRGAVGDKSSSSCSCASINKTRNGAKRHSLSQREVTV